MGLKSLIVVFSAYVSTFLNKVETSLSAVKERIHIHVDSDSLQLINKKERLKELLPMFKYTAKKYTVPIKVLVTTWIIETGYGSSTIFRLGYNFGGIKAYGKDLKVGRYKKYLNLLDGCLGLGKLLSSKRYYCKDCNEIQWFAKLKASGYWESKTAYSKRLKILKQDNVRNL